MPFPSHHPHGPALDRQQLSEPFQSSETDPRQKEILTSPASSCFNLILKLPNTLISVAVSAYC